MYYTKYGIIIYLRIVQIFSVLLIRKLIQVKDNKVIYYIESLLKKDLKNF